MAYVGAVLIVVPVGFILGGLLPFPIAALLSLGLGVAAGLVATAVSS